MQKDERKDLIKFQSNNEHFLEIQHSFNLSISKSNN
jgi:hypothetical protein